MDPCTEFWDTQRTRLCPQTSTATSAPPSLMPARVRPPPAHVQQGALVRQRVRVQPPCDRPAPAHAEQGSPLNGLVSSFSSSSREQLLVYISFLYNKLTSVLFHLWTNHRYITYLHNYYSFSITELYCH